MHAPASDNVSKRTNLRDNRMGLSTKMKALVAVCALSFAPAASAETLSGALAHAYDHSGLIDQNRALLRAADEDVAQAVAATLPVINWSASANAVEPRAPGADLISATARISGSLTLYDNGQNQLAIDSQKELVLGTRQGLRDIEQQVLLRAVEAYMNVRRDFEFVALRQNNVRLIAEELRAAQDRFDVGEVTRTDVSLAEARLASARSQLAAAEGSLARSREEYRSAVGRFPGQLTPVGPAPVSRGLSDAKAYAVRNHPDILEAQHAVKAAELNIMRAEAALLPTATLDGQISIDDEFEESVQLGVTVGGPIYQGGRLDSQVRQFMAQRDSQRASLHVIRHNLEQQVGNAFANLEVARVSRQASEEEIRAATVAFRGVREEATLGARTTLDVLEAEQDLFDARANQISAQADEVIASYALLSATGLLTVEHLSLPVQQYDPTAYYNLVKDAPTARSAQGQALDRVLKALGE